MLVVFLSHTINLPLRIDGRGEWTELVHPQNANVIHKSRVTMLLHDISCISCFCYYNGQTIRLQIKLTIFLLVHFGLDSLPCMDAVSRTRALYIFMLYISCHVFTLVFFVP